MSPGGWKERERASLLRGGAFLTSLPNLSRVAGLFIVIPPGSGPLECNPRFPDTSRQLCTICEIACTRRRPTFPWGDALRIMQRPLICARSRSPCRKYNHLVISSAKMTDNHLLIVSRFGLICDSLFLSAIYFLNDTYISTTRYHMSDSESITKISSISSIVTSMYVVNKYAATNRGRKFLIC